jgi:hypothetical protein
MLEAERALRGLRTTNDAPGGGSPGAPAAAFSAPGVELPFELRDARLERGELLAGTREHLGLDIELLPRHEIEATQGRAEERPEILLDVARGACRK